MSRGGTTMAASVWVSQLEVEYEEVEATLQAQRSAISRMNAVSLPEEPTGHSGGG
jgi:hypothetical protein